MIFLLWLLLISCLAGGLWLIFRLTHAVARAVAFFYMKRFDGFSGMPSRQNTYFQRNNSAFFLFDCAGLVIFTSSLLILIEDPRAQDFLIFPFLLLALSLSGFLMQRALFSPRISSILIITMPALLSGWGLYLLWFAGIFLLQSESPIGIWAKGFIPASFLWWGAEVTITFFLYVFCLLLSFWFLISIFLIAQQRKKPPLHHASFERSFFEKPRLKSVFLKKKIFLKEPFLFCLLWGGVSLGVSPPYRTLFEQLLAWSLPAMAVLTTLFQNKNAHDYQRWIAAFKNASWGKVQQETPLWAWILCCYILVLPFILYRNLAYGELNVFFSLALFLSFPIRDIIILHMVQFLTPSFPILWGSGVLALFYGGIFLLYDLVMASFFGLLGLIVSPFLLAPLLYVLWRLTLKRKEQHILQSQKIIKRNLDPSRTYH